MKRLLLAASALAVLSGAAYAQSAFNLTGGGIPGHVVLNNMGLSKVDTNNGVSTNQTLNNATLAGTTTAGPINSSGAIATTAGVTAGSVESTGDTGGATVTASGAVSGASVTATGAVTGGSLATAGAATAASVTATGAVVGSSIGIGTTTLSALPSPCVIGMIKNISDGLKPGESTGNGSGIPVICEVTTHGGSTTGWYSVFSGSAAAN